VCSDQSHADLQIIGEELEKIQGPTPLAIAVDLHQSSGVNAL
jgi:hypothetical protein